MIAGSGLKLGLHAHAELLLCMHCWLGSIPGSGLSPILHAHADLLLCIGCWLGSGPSASLKDEASYAGGRIEGEVWLNGHPKEQASFARVCGFVEQTDVCPLQHLCRKSFLLPWRPYEAHAALHCHSPRGSGDQAQCRHAPAIQVQDNCVLRAAEISSKL